MTSEIQRKHVEKDREKRVCPQHGEFESILWALDPPVMPSVKHEALGMAWALAPFWSRCPVCNGEMQREADQADEEIRGGLTMKERVRLERMRFANIPERFKDSTIWNWLHPTDQQDYAWQWARTYCDQMDEVLATGRSAVLIGTTGSGKTHLAIGVLKMFLDAGGTGYYTTTIDMLGRIKATYNPTATETETKVVKFLSTVDLLVLDEVGRQLDTNYEVAQLFRLLDLRSANLKPTIVISNLGRAEVTEFLGEHTIDRLAENGGKLLAFDWASHRRRKKPKAKVKEGKPS